MDSRIAEQGLTSGRRLRSSRPLLATHQYSGCTVAKTRSSRAFKPTPLSAARMLTSMPSRLENAELGVSRLMTPPINLSRLTFKTYEGLMHTYTNDELDDVVDWFEANVPEYRAHSAQDAFHTLSPAEHEREKHDAEEKMEVKWFKADAEVPARRRWRKSMVPRALRRHTRRRVGPKRLLAGGVLPGQFSF